MRDDGLTGRARLALPLPFDGLIGLGARFATLAGLQFAITGLVRRADLAFRCFRLAGIRGRDLLGDDLPPETINLVQQGDDFGWPRCHAGRIADPEFGGSQGCQGVKAPLVEMQAHSAPLGLAFYTGSQFPEAYRGNLFVAFHGSWNRTIPTGYKLVRIAMQGSQPEPVQDFASGWLLPNGSSWGRPVDVITGSDGSLFLSDDAGGKIYRIFYTRS